MNKSVRLYFSSSLAVDFLGCTTWDEVIPEVEGRVRITTMGGVDVCVGKCRDLVKMILYGYADAALLEVNLTVHMSPREWMSLRPIGRYILSRGCMRECEKPFESMPIQGAMSPGQAMAHFMTPPGSYDMILVVGPHISVERDDELKSSVLNFFNSQ